MAFLDWSFYGNTLRAWITALLVAGAIFALLEILRGLAARRLDALAGRTANEIDRLLAGLLSQTKTPLVALVSAYFGMRFLFLSPGIETALARVVIVALCIQGAIWGTTGLNFLLQRYVDRHLEADPSGTMTIRFLGFIGRAILWALFLLFALANLGVEITALVAGLGVGGIAVALAVQNILGDLFASLSIVLDKPFAVGDFIIVDDLLGTIEHVGLKTTRMRSLWGEQVVFSNNDLLKSRIRNYKQMRERRIVFGLRVAYETPHDKLARIPDMVREIVEAQEPIRFDRAHFHNYSPSSLDIETVYYVLDPSYNVYMDIQQAINLELYRRFEEEGIKFAHPVQMLYVNRVGAEAALPAGGSD